MKMYLNGLGTVTALYTVTLRSRVDGELMKVLSPKGRWSKKVSCWPRSIRARSKC